MCSVIVFFKQIQTSLFYHLDSATESSKSLKLGQPLSKLKKSIWGNSKDSVFSSQFYFFEK